MMKNDLLLINEIENYRNQNGEDLNKVKKFILDKFLAVLIKISETINKKYLEERKERMMLRILVELVDEYLTLPPKEMSPFLVKFNEFWTDFLETYFDFTGCNSGWTSNFI